LAQAAPRDDLLAAGQAQDRAAAARAIASGAPVDARDADGWSALMFAAAAGDAEFVRLLLRAKADANQRTNDGQTPLFAAVFSGKADAVRALLQAGARADTALPGGKTPLMLASERGRQDLVALLRAAPVPAAGSRTKAELASAAGAQGVRAPMSSSATASTAVNETGVPDDLIRAFVLEVAKIEGQQAAVSAARAKVEGRERESEQERQRLAAAARERYDTCLARVKTCESQCEQRAMAGILGAVQPGAGRSRTPNVDTQAMLSASQDGDSCRLNCAQSAACEAIKP
jgi:hypothetical protein